MLSPWTNWLDSAELNQKNRAIFRKYKCRCSELVTNEKNWINSLKEMDLNWAASRLSIVDICQWGELLDAEPGFAINLSLWTLVRHSFVFPPLFGWSSLFFLNGIRSWSIWLLIVSSKIYINELIANFSGLATILWQNY